MIMGNYKIRNISGHLSFLGLCPGESKIVTSVTGKILDLYNKNQISLEKIPVVAGDNKKTKKEQQTIVVEKTKNNDNKDVDNNKNIKECEVTDNGGNQNSEELSQC